MISVYVVQVFFVHKRLLDLASISKVRILVYAPFVAVPQSSRTSPYGYTYTWSSCMREEVFFEGSNYCLKFNNYFCYLPLVGL